MKESQWRSKLIQLRKKSNPNDFIWPIGNKFRAGFPDLYLLNNSIPNHIELKIGHFYEVDHGLAKIQLLTLKELAKAGAQCYCFNLEPEGVGITTYLQDNIRSRIVYHHQFDDIWTHQNFIA